MILVRVVTGPWILPLVLLCQLADYGTFVAGYLTHIEANPAANALWAAGGPVAVLAMKCAGISLGLALLARRPAMARVGLSIIAVGGLIGVAANLSA